MAVRLLLTAVDASEGGREVKVVITGGCGFLGQQLARSLLRRGSLTGPSGGQEDIGSLVLFDTASPGGPELDDKRVEVVLGDITDRGTIFSLCDRDDCVGVPYGFGNERRRRGEFRQSPGSERGREPERPRGPASPGRPPAAWSSPVRWRSSAVSS